MKLIDLKVNDFINEVDSKSPAPGGGSVAALAGSLSSALARMVSQLTVGKKRYRNLEEDQQNRVLLAQDILLRQKDAFTELIDKDTEAFNMIMAAFKLPKKTDENKSLRKEAILNATIEAIEVPKLVVENSEIVLDTLETLFLYGNPNCLSDLGVSALLLHTTIIGALMNMKINLSGLPEGTEKEDYSTFIEKFTEFSHQEVLGFVGKVYHKL